MKNNETGQLHTAHHHSTHANSSKCIVDTAAGACRYARPKPALVKN